MFSLTGIPSLDLLNLSLMNGDVPKGFKDTVNEHFLKGFLGAQYILLYIYFMLPFGNIMTARDTF